MPQLVDVVILLVCIDIVLIVEVLGEKSLRWSLGPCSSGDNELKYYRNGKYKERCCVLSGTHILSCHSSDMSLGWNYVQIRIDGHSYCDDFITLKAMRKVAIHGMQYFQNQSIFSNEYGKIFRDAYLQ